MAPTPSDLPQQGTLPSVLLNVAAHHTATDTPPQHHQHGPASVHSGPRGNDATEPITFLAWNCRGSGGSLRSATMTHLRRLLTSTKAQVCFISETRNASISRTSLVNHFNVDAFVVPSQGQSGGLWLMWTNEVEVSIYDHNHHYILALCKNKTSNQQYGLICIYGDPHHRFMNVIWDQVLEFVTFNANMPMFCMGDMNEIMHNHEKLGPSCADVNRINVFCAYVKQCGFIDLGYNGPAYTWTNKRFSSVPTYERLDRCLGNAEWCRAFPSTTIYHLPMMYSDHSPILAVLNSTRPRIHKPFRFENWWLMEQDFQDIAQQSWQRSSARDFSLKTKFLVADLRKWRRKQPNNNVLLAHVEAQILDQQTLHPSIQNHTLQKQLHDQHHNLMAKEETFHLQRFKKSWAVKGDRNTDFFHSAIIKRNRKKRSLILLTRMVLNPPLLNN
jgi:endonuclease/exonuclease/phosphatase family metal-dependent hydrolase